MFGRAAKSGHRSRNPLIYEGGYFIIVRSFIMLAHRANEMERGGEQVKKANQEELVVKIGKLKEKAKAAAEKAGGKQADPSARKARKKVKRAQRKLRAAKAYKSGGKKKAAEAAAAPAAAPAATA